LPRDLLEDVYFFLKHMSQAQIQLIVAFKPATNVQVLGQRHLHLILGGNVGGVQCAPLINPCAGAVVHAVQLLRAAPGVGVADRHMDVSVG